MQDPNLDTEWNDVLRAKGIIPQKEVEITEEELIDMVEKTITAKSQGETYKTMKLDKLNDLEDDIDEEDEKMFEEYRRQRIEELKSKMRAAKFGDVREISRDEYVQEVNQAGEGIYVILLVYKQSVPLCKLMEQYILDLARKHPATKFLKSISSVCIPNYPDKNLPTIFVYKEGELKKQFVGPDVFNGLKLTKNELEWMLHDTGAIMTDLEDRPSRKVHDVMQSSLRSALRGDDSD